MTAAELAAIENPFFSLELKKSCIAVLSMFTPGSENESCEWLSRSWEPS